MFHYGSHGKKLYIIIKGKVSVLIPSKKEEAKSKFISIKELSDGESFGEIALLRDQPRMASIFCLTDCHFAVLSKEDFMKTFGKEEEKKLDDLLEFFRDIPIFKTWSKKKLDKIILYFNHQIYYRNQIVFAEGTSPRFVYIVKKGEFEIKKKINIKKKNYFDQNFSFKEALLGPKEMFGEKEVLSNSNYSTTCTCYSTSGELLSITVENFMIKFDKQSVLVDFVDNRKYIYLNRNQRLEKMKDILLDNKKVEKDPKKVLTKRINQTNPFYIKRISPPIVPKPWKFVNFTEEKLKKIKQRALAFRESRRIYFNINKPLELNSSNESLKNDAKSLRSQSSYDGMMSNIFYS